MGVLGEVLKARGEVLDQVEEPQQYAEVRRICDLPLVPDLEPEEVEEANRHLLLAKAWEEGFRLWPVQVRAIMQYQMWGGLFGQIGVGWGKTLITIVVADLAFRAGIPRILLLIPSTDIDEFVNEKLPFARTRVPVSYPVQMLAGKSIETRRALARSKRTGLYVCSHRLMSTPEARDMLSSIDPGLIIADECDVFANPGAAGTKRLMEHVAERAPQGGCLSGTVSTKSLRNFKHLAKWCLGERCPLPRSESLLREWSNLVDADSQGGQATGPIKPLLKWASDNYPRQEITEDLRGFRTALRLRIRSCPGVATTKGEKVSTLLVIHDEPAQLAGPGADQVKELMRRVGSPLNLTPNDDEIEHAIHQYKWLYELTAGFYNKLTWPSVDELAERTGAPAGAAAEVLDCARAHRGVQRDYAKALRQWLQENSRPNLDTPLLVGRSMALHGPADVGGGLHHLWKMLKAADIDLGSTAVRTGIYNGTPKGLERALEVSFRDSAPVRVCSYKVDAAVRWAVKEGRGIIWVYHKGMGDWVHEALLAAGVQARYCPAGKVHDKAIRDPANKDRVVVASMRAHGRGKNLQHIFHSQFFLQWPRSSNLCEQVLGRTHRNGQRSDIVWAFTSRSIEFDDMVLAATLNDALYFQQVLGDEQKVIYCEWSPDLPKSYPSDFLRERGMTVKKLDTVQAAHLREKFPAGRPGQ